MTNNSSYTVPTEETSPACLVYIIRPLTNHVALVTAVINAILSFVAMAGNGVILATIWRSASLRTPSYILLGGLAFTDFCTGLITQSSYVVFRVASMTNYMRLFCVARSIALNSGLFFTSVTTANIAFMAIERWIHMNRRSLLTKRRVIVIDSVILVFLLALVPGNHVNMRITWITALCLALLSISVTSVTYFKLFQLINRHRHQVKMSELSHNFTPPPVNAARYKKSVFTILYILVVFLLTNLPYVCCAAVVYASGDVRERTLTALDVCTTILFASSSVNPLLYYWRMRDIREGVKCTLNAIWRR